MATNNELLKAEIRTAGLRLYDIAEAMGISYSYLRGVMTRPLNADKEARVKEAIKTAKHRRAALLLVD